MENTELIKVLRCELYGDDECDKSDCPIWSELGCKNGIANRAAADALEAYDKRVAELEKSYSWKAYAALEESIEGYKTRIAELEAQMPKWTMLKDEMPKPHTKVLVSGIEAINNVRVYKVMVNDNGTLRPTDYAPSIRWDYWMPFESPNCGAKMGKEKGDE